MTTDQILTDSDGGKLQLHRDLDGGMTVWTSTSHATHAVGPFPIADLRVALDALEPQEAGTAREADHFGYLENGERLEEHQEAEAELTIKQTEADFAKARLAVYEDGRIAARFDPKGRLPWAVERSTGIWDWCSDEQLARWGWRIVNPNDTTPEDALKHFVSLLYEPKTDVIPAGTPFVSVYGDGSLGVRLYGADHDVSTHPGGAHHRLIFRSLDEPEWAKADAVWAFDSGDWFIAESRGDGKWVCGPDLFTYNEISSMDPHPIWNPKSQHTGTGK